MDINLSKLWKMVRDREAWHATDHGVTELDMTGLLYNNNNNNIIIFAISYLLIIYIFTYPPLYLSFHLIF